MILLSTGLTVLCLFLIIENYYLKRDKKDLIEICQTVFENEQYLMNELEKFTNQITKN